MKGPLIAVLALAVMAPPLLAQNGAEGSGPAGWRRELRQLNLSPAEIKAIRDIVDRQADGLAKAESEMRIIQAKLERLLLDANPDMGAARELVKSSLDWELQVRMARLERAVELRKLLGPERWARLQRLQREYLAAKKAGRLKPGDLGDNAEGISELLDRLE